MANFEAPSFSLGLDLDFDSEPQISLREDSTCKRAPDSSTYGSFRTLEDDDEEFEPQVVDSDPEIGVDPPRILKRLRRGATTESASVRKRESPEVRCNGDDDIEEFSSQENLRRDDRSSTQYHSMCSSSKFPLHGHGFLTTQSTSQSRERKRRQVPHASASSSLETSSDKLMFPKLTISPLRMFQLLDSDSDDLTVNEDVPRDSNKIDPLSKEKESNCGQNATPSEEKRIKASVSLPQNEDLWKDFCPMKRFNIPTPALDEVCEEYFSSATDKNVVRKLASDVCVSNNKGCNQKENSSQDVQHHWDLADPHPPAHLYFFHDDPRIQKLVRSRLPNFFPLDVVKNRGNKQPGGPVIDYMSQFNQGESSKQQVTRNSNVVRSSTKGRRNSKNSNAAEVSNASGSWVNPKRSASIPKDAGRRRVHAEGNSAGHWYTAQDGRRVYVAKSGQELTGRIAYRHYRKESGARFKKSKKKTRAKKK